MQELKKQVDEIFTMVSLLRVSGDAVDIVATVREKLRRLYKHIEKLPDVQPPDIPTTAVSEPCAKEAATDGGQDNG